MFTDRGTMRDKQHSRTAAGKRLLRSKVARETQDEEFLLFFLSSKIMVMISRQKRCCDETARQDCVNTLTLYKIAPQVGKFCYEESTAAYKN